MSTRAGRGCRAAVRLASGLTFLRGFLMILSARGWPLLQVLGPRFWPETGFDCRLTNEAIGHLPLQENELLPRFGFVRAQFPHCAVPLAWHFEPLPRFPSPVTEVESDPVFPYLLRADRP